MRGGTQLTLLYWLLIAASLCCDGLSKATTSAIGGVMFVCTAIITLGLRNIVKELERK